MSSGSADESQATVLYKTGRVLVRVMTTLLWDLKVYGLENVPRTGGVLLISNHQSYLDPMLLAVQLRRPVSFLARSTLFEKRAFGWLISRLNAFPVRRGEGDIGAVKEAIRRLKEGRVLMMFPEGTRSRDGKLGRIQPGISMLVRRAGVPVVPAAISGAFQAWPRSRKLPRAHPIRVVYGKPLETEGLKGEKLVELIGKRVREVYEQAGRL